MRSTPGHVARVALINLSAAVAATLMFVWFDPAVATISAVAIRFAHALVYSYAIGFTAAAVIPLCRPLFDPGRLTARTVPVVAGALSVSVMAGAFVGGLLLTLAGLQGREEYWPQLRRILGFSFIVTFVFGLGTFAYESIRRRLYDTAAQLRERELAESRAREAAIEARLASLESRLRPHFLFNTLNAIAELISEDPARAEATVGRLAGLLRFTLDTSQHRLVRLDQELAIVADYLEIERTRLGDRLQYHVDVDAALGSALVPPLAVQTLVENSVTHVVARRRESGCVKVTVRRDSLQLLVDVADDGPGFSLERAPQGRGLDHLRERLSTLFGSAASVETHRLQADAVVRLVLPWTSHDREGGS